MPSEAKCAVVIVTYNGTPWIAQCIRSCEESEYPVDIIVVDNHSQDATLSLIPDVVRLIPLRENLGFGRANNIGMMVAIEEMGADYVFLLNQDAYIAPDAISELVAAQQRHPELGLISPMHYDGQGEELDYRFVIYHRRALRKGRAYAKDKGLMPTHFVNAAAWFLSKEAILRNGGFDPIFRHTGEDDNFCQRLRHKGIPLAICTRARIQHDRQNRPQPSPPPFLRVDTRAKVILYSLTMPLLVKWVLLGQLFFEYLINLTQGSFRTGQKFRADYLSFKAMLAHLWRYKKVYQQEGAFLRQDYPHYPKASE